MKLSTWAKQQGIGYNTALKWFKNNTLPVKSAQMPTGTILVYPDESLASANILDVVLYARVSSHDQKEDLSRQLIRLRDYCSASGFDIKNEYQEIASGMNSNRKKLNKILLDKSIQTIVVEHQDRLTRFGFELIESSLKSCGRQIIVINKTEYKMDLVQDFVDVVTSMCAKIYGRRGSANRAKLAVIAVDKPINEEISP